MSSKPMNRREMLAGSGTVVALATLGASAAGIASENKSNTLPGGAAGVPNGLSVLKNGQYETVPLKQEEITVAAIQAESKAVDIRNLKATKRANLEHVLWLIDKAQGAPAEWGDIRRWGGKKDLICMPEFPLQGFQPWTRKELEQVAFEVPGPETEAIGEKAKKYGCYIAFGAYTLDKDWPGHIINSSIIVGPDGEIVAKLWKPRNEITLSSTYGGKIGLMTSTIYDVLDRYVEMYGWEAVMPIVKTDIGNIAMAPVIDPMVDAVLALRGAEVMVLSGSGAGDHSSRHARLSSSVNGFYAVCVGNSVMLNNLGYPDTAGAIAGGTAIFSPSGKVMAETGSHHEDLAIASIPIGEFRKTRAPVELPMEMYLPFFQQYEPAYKKNAFLEYLPKDYPDSGNYIYKRLGWD